MNCPHGIPAWGSCPDCQPDEPITYRSTLPVRPPFVATEADFQRAARDITPMETDGGPVCTITVTFQRDGTPAMTCTGPIPQKADLRTIRDTWFDLAFLIGPAERRALAHPLVGDTARTALLTGLVQKHRAEYVAARARRAVEALGRAARYCWPCERGCNRHFQSKGARTRHHNLKHPT